MTQSRNRQKAKKLNYSLNKEAFDSVMHEYRDSNTYSIGAMQYNDNGAVSRYEAKPTPTDFRCDVEQVLKQFLTKFITASMIQVAYVDYDSDVAVEIEIHAQNILGSSRHGFEQRVGAEFNRRGIYPTSGNRGYFHVIRQPQKGAL